MRYSICNELFEGWSWERICDFVRELGYTGLEVAPFTLAESRRRRSRPINDAHCVALRKPAACASLPCTGSW